MENISTIDLVHELMKRMPEQVVPVDFPDGRLFQVIAAPMHVLELQEAATTNE